MAEIPDARSLIPVKNLTGARYPVTGVREKNLFSYALNSLLLQNGATNP
jgi:hypothetical protein